jgi:hypothetical protein
MNLLEIQAMNNNRHRRLSTTAGSNRSAQTHFSPADSGRPTD